MVNTASKCGITPQFEGLEKLYKKLATGGEHKDQFVVLGFPCNQFMNQDPVCLLPSPTPLPPKTVFSAAHTVAKFVDPNHP